MMLQVVADRHDGVSRPENSEAPDLCRSQVQRVGSRERVLDRETLTSKRLYSTSQGRPRHFVKVETRRAAPRRARDTITCTYKRYTCIIYMCIVLLHPSHPTAKIAMVVISCLIFACQRGACGIACQEPTIGARRKIVGGMGACSPCLFQELYTAICLCHKSFASTNLNITIDSLRLSIFKRLSHDKEYNNFADLHQRK